MEEMQLAVVEEKEDEEVLMQYILFVWLFLQSFLLKI